MDTTPHEEESPVTEAAGQGLAGEPDEEEECELHEPGSGRVWHCWITAYEAARQGLGL